MTLIKTVLITLLAMTTKMIAGLVISTTLAKVVGLA
jgi:hypothetical protein